jgi:hypothetical protein
METSGEYGESEKPLAFDEILAQLKEKVDMDKFRKLNEAKETAQFLFDVYKTPETKINLEEATGKTALLLTLAVATKWKETESNNLVERRRLIGMMRAIFLTENRGYRRETDLVHQGVASGIFALLVAYKMPECWGVIGLDGGEKDYLVLDINEREKKEKEILKWLKNKESGEMTDLGYNANWSEDTMVLNEIWNELDIPVENRIVFKGGYLPSLDMVVFVSKPSRQTMEHEMLHQKSKCSLRVGVLGCGIDEGVTEYLALTKTYKKGSYLKEKYKYSGYAPEVDLVRNLKSWQPKIFNSLLERYMGDSSMNFEAEVINKYGIDGLVDLYCANPYVKDRNQEKNYGHILETKYVQKKLGLAKRLLF